MKGLWEFITAVFQLAWYGLLIVAAIGLVASIVMLGAQKGGV